jgi:hypothetical protein
MDSTDLIKPPARPAIARHQRSEATSARRSDSQYPPLKERLGEIVPLICVVPEAGPPVIFLVGPWVLFALMLTGPFLLLVTFVLAAVILLAITVAVLAPAYLIIRRLKRHWRVPPQRHTPVHRPRARHSTGVRLRTHHTRAELFPRPAAPAAAQIDNQTQAHLTSEGA